MQVPLLGFAKHGAFQDKQVEHFFTETCSSSVSAELADSGSMEAHHHTRPCIVASKHDYLARKAWFEHALKLSIFIERVARSFK